MNFYSPVSNTRCHSIGHVRSSALCLLALMTLRHMYVNLNYIPLAIVNMSIHTHPHVCLNLMYVVANI